MPSNYFRVGLIVPSSNTVMEPDFHRELGAALSPRRQTIQIRPTNQTRPRAQCERLRNISTAPDATIQQDLYTAARCVCNLRQNLDGRWQAVQLPPAVVGHNDAVNSVFDGKPCILCRHDAFEEQRARP